MLDVDLAFGSLATNCVLGLTAIFLLYCYSTRNHDYWKKRGITYIKPVPFLGSSSQIFSKTAHELTEENYKKYGLIYGFFEGNKPCLSVAEPDLLRDIFVKNFSTFPTRREIVTGHPIFDKMLGNIKGDDDWKRIRSIITPTFTTGKIKRTLGIFKDCSKTVVSNFQNASKEGKPVDAKKLYGAYTTDVIASSAFSTKIDSHNDPDNPFVKYASKAFEFKINWKVILFIMFPPLSKLFKFTFFPPEVMEFFKEITLQIIEERKRTGQTRNDFLQLLIDTAKEVEEDEKPELSEKEGDIASNYGMQEDINPHILNSVKSKKLSMDELVAQCVAFFMVGYDTTASTLSFATYFLALNPKVQDRVRNEVDEVLRESNGDMTYEALQKMKYLDNVISEALRLYPPLIRIDRTAESDYKLGNTGITVTKGMIVTIPFYAIHRDPKIFPDPEKFDPDRFTPEERAKRDPYAYMPFGAGPRNCAAMRFALIEVKVCLAYVIANFNIKRCPETKVPLEFDVGQVILQPKGIILEMETRKDSPLLE